MFALVRQVFALSLIPIAPFTWFGLTVSSLDLAATVRLVLVMRQLKDALVEAKAAAVRPKKGAGPKIPWEDASFVKEVGVVLTVVYGGEAISSSWLGFQPSFLLSPTFPLLYAGTHALISSFPSVPQMSLKTELPFSILDGFSRAYLVCALIPPAITKHSNPAVQSNPWSLLLTSLITANGGFFLVGLFSMMDPTGFRLSTPQELRAWGWTTVDLWCAPFVTGLYAFWTHAQPYWGELHARSLGYTEITPNVLRFTAVDSETAMARCVVVMGSLFVTRTLRNFGPAYLEQRRKRNEVGEEKKQQ